MRKITQNVTNAFENGRAFSSGHDCVNTDGKTVSMFLHGNKIAERKNGKLTITNCGWQTNVTKERLNALRGVHIQQKNFVWYLNGVAWDGSWIEIK